MSPFEDELPEDKAEIDESEQDIEPIKTAHSPAQPTPEQEEEHRCTHQPYRSWCKWCVMGRGLGEQHRSSPGSTIPKVGADYFFITAGGVKKEEELGYTDDDDGRRRRDEARAKGEIVKCVLVRCSLTKNVFAHVVPCKGVDEDDYTARLVAADIEWLGHTRVIIKADNERALKKLIRRAIDIIKVMDHHPEGISNEDPAPYDSQSNGGTEVGVRAIRGLFRTTKLCLEARINKYIPVDHALVPWLLEHVCLLLNARVRGPDGLTSWARSRGRAFNQRLLGFGERVLYKLPGKGPRHDPDGNMGTGWLEAIFLGYKRSSNSYILATKDGITTARSLARRPMANRWCEPALSEIKATPWSERERSDVKVRFEEAATAQDDPVGPPDAEKTFRRFRINKSDLTTHRYTEGCEQCEHTERYGQSKGGIGHSDACRARILEAIRQTPRGRSRLDDYELKINRNIAESIEKADRADKAVRDAQPRPEHPHPVHDGAQQERASASSSDSRPQQQQQSPANTRPEHISGGNSRDRSSCAKRAERAYDQPVAEEIPGNASTPEQDGGPPNELRDEEMAERANEDEAMETSFIGRLEPEIGDVAA